MSSSPIVGKPAPSFEALNQNDQPVSSKSLAGKWVVVYFYPKDDTPGCTVEACEFTSGMEGFNTLDAVVLGVSADSTESHRAFIKKFDLNFDLLSDPDMKMIKGFGVWGEKVRDGKTSMGILRQTFLINPEGNLARHWPAVTPKGHAEEVREAIASLRG